MSASRGWAVGGLQFFSDNVGHIKFGQELGQYTPR